jgi:hypothetical protein
VRGDDGV